MHRKLGLGLGILILIIFSIFLIWSFDKGFDLSDEGLATLGFSSGQEINASFSSFLHYTRAFLPEGYPSIIESRYLRFLLIMIGALVLALGLKVQFNLFRWRFRGLQIFLLIGGVGTYTYGGRGLEYNSLTLIFMLIGFGLLLYGQARRSWIAMLASGFFIGSVFFFKITSGAGFIGLGLLLIMLLNWGNSKAIIQDMLLSILGMLVCFLWYFAFVEPLSVYLLNLKTTISLYSTYSESHNSGFMMRDIWNTVLRSGFWLAISGIVMIGLWLINKQFQKKMRKEFWYVLVHGLIIIIAIIGVYQENIYRHGYLYWVILIFEFFLHSRSNWYADRENWPKMFLLIALLLMPFILALGSNNGLMNNSRYGVIFWMGFLICFYHIMDVRWPYYFKTAGLFVCVIACLLFVNQYHNPYRTVSLKYATENVDLPHEPHLKVDLSMKTYVHAVREKLEKNGFKPGDGIIGAYRMPGLIYLLQGRSPGDILWGHNQFHLYGYNLSLSKMNLSNVFILDRGKIAPKNIAILKQYGIDFPEKFEEIGQVYWDGWEYKTTKIYKSNDF